MSIIELFGISGERIEEERLARIFGCKAVVAAARFAPLLQGFSGRRIAITPLSPMLEELEAALEEGDVAVLASGDPLFFGIGRTLLKRFGEERLRISPALSAVQLACARFKVPWDDLSLISLHGRRADSLPGRILGREKALLFTDGHNSPDKVARLLLDTLAAYGAEARGATIRMRVAENLGCASERLSNGTLEEMAARQFAPLNMVLVEQELPEQTLPVFGLREGEIVHSRGLITKDEVRAVILHCLRLPRRGVFWDVGGGSGSISLEAASLAPELDIFTLEKKEEGQDNIRANIARLNRYNVRLVAGEAPEAFAGLPDPQRIFVGGSGGRLEEILRLAAARLAPGGRLVVSAVLPRTAALAPELLRELGLVVTVRTIGVTRKDGPDGQEKKLNSITIITGKIT